MPITAEVAAAIEEVRQAFPAHTVTFDEDGQGSAYVTVAALDIGTKYEVSTAACSFHIGFQYPRSDIYPHYIDGHIKRRDVQSRAGVQEITWRDRQVLQLSRRSNKWNPATDTAAIKLTKVLEWFKTL
jgi:hypothetical protein